MRGVCAKSCLYGAIIVDKKWILHVFAKGAPAVMEELHCPQCDSNSQRHLKEKKK